MTVVVILESLRGTRLAEGLRARYAAALDEPLPEEWLRLAKRFETAQSGEAGPSPAR